MFILRTMPPAMMTTTGVGTNPQTGGITMQTTAAAGHSLLYIDLGLLGVNEPRRSREARIVTHNLNDLGFVNLYTGKSPVSWQLNGEFATNGGMRQDYLGQMRDALVQYNLLDMWARNGEHLILEQYPELPTSGSSKGRTLGAVRIRQLSEGGSVLVNQTMTTQWSMTLLFDEEYDDDEQQDGRPVSNTDDTAGTMLGEGGGTLPGPGGTMPGGPTMPMMPDMPDVTDVPTRPEPDPDTDEVRLSILTIPDDFHINIPFHQHTTSVLLQRSTLPSTPGMMPGTPGMPMFGMVERLDLVTLVVEIPLLEHIRNTGFFIWVERWTGAHRVSNLNARLWEPLYPDQIHQWLPSLDNVNTLTWTGPVDPGTEGTWTWLRVRYVYATDPTPDDGMDPLPNTRETSRDNSNISHTLGIHWGPYNNTGEEIDYPPGTEEGDTGEEIPEAGPVEARAEIASVTYYYPETQEVQFGGGGPMNPFQPRANPLAGQEFRADEVRSTGARVYQIPYETWPKLVYLIKVSGGPDEQVRQVTEYSVTIQTWSLGQARVWTDLASNDGFWLNAAGGRGNLTTPGPTLTGLVTVTSRQFQVTSWARQASDMPGAEEIDWYRFMFNMGGDIFYSTPVAIVYPNNPGPNYRSFPPYNYDPPE